MAEECLWWQKGIIYQIYPRSFMDGNGDGIGDLMGIASRLDYVQRLGVDAIWLSPIYPSPMADFGYDVSDYVGIDPIFGCMADFDRLLEETHKRGMKLILDFVPNHTSDQHAWFSEARASRNSAKRDWYIWRDPAPGGGPPNNWLSNFGGSAWELDPATGQYYYHAFLKEQPDLNWRNPEVRAAMNDVLKFWLDKGVDGFRVDVIWHLVKDEQFRDNPRNPEYSPDQSPHRQLLATYDSDRPEVHDIIAGMRKVLDSYPERMMVGEVYLPVERLVTYYGGGEGAHLPFNFQLIHLPWHAREIAAAINNYEAMLPDYGWPNWVLGNHDKPRIATRVGPAQARVAGMLLLTLRGTPTLYYGDEIGMHDVSIPPELVQDPYEKNVPGLGLGRDPQRTPMQWSSGPGAGFTTGSPWLPLAADVEAANVAEEEGDPSSMLTFYRRLIELRRSESVLQVGSYSPLDGGEHLIAFVRHHQNRRVLVALNLSSAPRSLNIRNLGVYGTVLISTHLDRWGDRVEDLVELRGDEGIVVALD